jgi:hypothetical protein
MFVALTNDDAALFNSVTSADFYAFDVGKRFDGNALLQLVKQAHAAGKIYEWKVTEPEVRVDGSTALVTYVNQGSLKNATDLTQLSWLESAVIRKEGGEWRIHFFPQHPGSIGMTRLMSNGHAACNNLSAGRP